MTPLTILGGNYGEATTFNNRDQVVGFSENTTKDPTCVTPRVLEFKPVIWQKDEDNVDIQELPTVSGDPDGVANGINDEGQATGQSGNCAMGFNASFHAVLWQPGQPKSSNDDDRAQWTATDLGSLGGKINNAGADINNRGQVVGKSGVRGDNTFHAFLWQDDVMRDLGTLPDDFSSTGDGINDEGQVVGGSST